MKTFILLVIAIVIFILISPIGIIYTSIYYIWKEVDKGYTYSYRCAFAIDVLANCLFGELFELFLCKGRGKTLFGTSTSISASAGELIITGRFHHNRIWFVKMLDKAFSEKDHCLNAYKKEILKEL